MHHVNSSNLCWKLHYRRKMHGASRLVENLFKVIIRFSVLSEKPTSKLEKYRSTLEVYIHKALPERLSNAFTDVFLSISLKDKSLYKIYQVYLFSVFIRIVLNKPKNKGVNPNI